MAWPTYVVADLASFSGNDVSYYSNTAYVTTVIAQSLLLFRRATGLGDWPADSLDAELAKNGVLDLANTLYMAQSYQGVSVSPFQSETIGSYTYSKATTLVASKQPLGIGWFDLAVAELAVADNAAIRSNSISIMENDDTLATDDTGQIHYLGPLEQDVPIRVVGD